MDLVPVSPSGQPPAPSPGPAVGFGGGTTAASTDTPPPAGFSRLFVSGPSPLQLAGATNTRTKITNRGPATITLSTIRGTAAYQGRVLAQGDSVEIGPISATVWGITDGGRGATVEIEAA